MAYTTLAVVDAAEVGSGALAYVALGNDPNGRKLEPNDGTVGILAKNAGAGAQVVHIKASRTVHGLAVAERTVSLGAGEEKLIGPFAADIYNVDASDATNPNAVLIYTTDANITVAAIRVK